MRVFTAIVVALTVSAQGSFAQAPAPTPPAAKTPLPAPAPATMKELMLDLIFPTSDTLFYVARGAPKTDTVSTCV